MTAHLREQIIDGLLAPGEKLPSENVLVQEHGVSRTVVREALLRLSAEGLVYTRRGSGSFVLTPPSGSTTGAVVPRPAAIASPTGRMDLIDYRVAIETESAALAAARGTDDLRAGVQRAAGDFAVSAADNADPAELLNLDFAFHRAVASASANPLLLEAIDAMGPAMIAMPPARLDRDRAGSGPEERSRIVAAEHSTIAAFITAGDAQGAAAAMRTHLRNSARRVLDESPGRAGPKGT
ncbi:FCD domain-containing protein [Micrococcus terreus]|uniref:FadR/GntR family transcriptional regulator n=1 Tax=Micrococcus terreus TaxID=574650 RepID=UPI0033DC1A29